MTIGIINQPTVPNPKKTEEKSLPIYRLYEEFLKDVETGNFSPEIKTRLNESGEIILLAENGKDAHIQDAGLQKFIRTSGFKNWFGDSRVIYQDTGEPIPVFNGIEEEGTGDKDLYANSIVNGPNLRSKNIHSPHLSEIIYLTSHVLDAKSWSVVAGNKKGRVTVFPAFLKIEKPETFEIHTDLMRAFRNPEWAEILRDKTKRDGIIQWSGLTYTTHEKVQVINSDQFAVFNLDQVMWLPLTLIAEREKSQV